MTIAFPARLRARAFLSIALIIGAVFSVAAQSPQRAKMISGIPTFGDSIAVLLNSPGVKYAYPRWSHDSKHVLYQSNETGRWQLRVIDIAAKQSRAITADSANNNFIDWSPDNSWVAFVSDRKGEEDLYTMNTAGGSAVSLAPSPEREIHPYINPDGKSLLFNSTRDGLFLQVYHVNRDGSDLKRLTFTNDEITCARMSPDMKSIVMLRAYRNQNDEVFAMDADGAAMRNLTNSAAAEGWPAWYPDGSRILYSSDPTGTFCLYSMKPDGSDVRQVTHASGPWVDARGSVSPNGNWIVFNREQDDATIAIVIMPLPRAK